MSTANYRGELGEEFVADYLLKNGYTLRSRNFKCPFGEIDIIADNGREISFTEVKTRLETSLGEPCEAVTLSKQRKIIVSASMYLANNEIDLQPTFDVYEVICVKDSYFSVKELRIHKNAFTMNEKNCRGLNFI